MDKYKDNESNVWALIYNQCSPELKNMLRGTEGYERAKGTNGLVRILFRFRLGLIFRNLQKFRVTLDSAEHTPELNHTRARLICSGILRNPESSRNPEGRTHETSTLCCCHCCHSEAVVEELAWWPAVAAAVAAAVVAAVVAAAAAATAAAQSSSSPLSSSSSSLLILLVGIVLPLFVARYSFHRPTLARLQCAMVGCCLRLSATLFVFTHHPAIVDDSVSGRRPPVHLVALLSPAASTCVALRSSKASSLRTSRRHRHRCRHITNGNRPHRRRPTRSLS